MKGINLETFLTSIACGLVVDTLLIVNNYRDHDNDKKAGKKTLIVHIGKRNGEQLYLWLGLLGASIMIGINIYEAMMNGTQSFLLPFYAIYIALHWLTYHKMRSIGEGKELNKVLGLTARNIFIFGITGVVVTIGSALFSTN